MPDYYHSPALILMALLLPAFGYLYLRFRDARSLLWFLGFLCSIVAMVLLYTMNGYPGAGSPWLVASGQTFIQLSAALFLGSLSPLRFRVGRFQILFVVPYVAFLVPIPNRDWLRRGVRRKWISHGCWLFLKSNTLKTTSIMVMAIHTTAKPGCGDLAKQIAAPPDKLAATRKAMPPYLHLFLGMFLNKPLIRSCEWHVWLETTTSRRTNKYKCR